jgi:hypothetical protein
VQGLTEEPWHISAGIPDSKHPRTPEEQGEDDNIRGWQGIKHNANKQPEKSGDMSGTYAICTCLVYCRQTA